MPSKAKKFTVNDYVVSFGPNGTIVASCPNDIFFHNINASQDLSDKLSHANGANVVAYPAVGRPIASSNSRTEKARFELVLVDEVSDPYVAYSRKSKMVGNHHEMYKPSSEAAMPKLGAWLDARLSQSSLQVVSNALGGWWALSARGETAFDSITPPLRQLLKPSNPDGKVIHVALGIDNTFVAIFENGNFQWDLKNLYPDLDSYLAERSTNDLVYVSLDPFRAGRYFAAFSDATVLYNLPESAAELERALIDADDLRVILFSDTVRHSAIALPQNRSMAAEFVDETARKLADKVEEQAAESMFDAGLAAAEAVAAEAFDN